MRLVELGQGGLEVAALALELLHVGHGLVVLALGQRVDGTELLAAALEALDAGTQGLALVVGQLLIRRLGSEPELRGELVELALGVGGGVAHLLRGHLRRRHGLAGLPQPRLQLGLLVRERAQRGGGLLPALRVALELGGQRVAAGAHGAAGGLQGARGALAVARRRGVALGARAQALQVVAAPGALGLGALGQAPFGAQVGEQLGPAHRPGPLVRRLAAARDHPLRPAQPLGGLADRAGGAPQRHVGLLAGGVGGAHGGARALARVPGGGLLGHRCLGAGDQLVAPAALLEHALGAALGGLPELAARAVERAPRSA